MENKAETKCEQPEKRRQLVPPPDSAHSLYRVLSHLLNAALQMGESGINLMHKIHTQNSRALIICPQNSRFSKQCGKPVSSPCFVARYSASLALPCAAWVWNPQNRIAHEPERQMFSTKLGMACFGEKTRIPSLSFSQQQQQKRILLYCGGCPNHILQFGEKRLILLLVSFGLLFCASHGFVDSVIVARSASGFAPLLCMPCMRTV